MIETLKAFFIAGALYMQGAPAPDYSFVLEAQSGAIARLSAETTDEQFIAAAQREANRRREAIAVTQNGRLVVLINYKR